MARLHSGYTVRVVAGFSVVALALTLLGPVSGAPARASDAVTVPPAAAQLQEVVMACLSGQVDINHADADALWEAWELDLPLAERVIENRPYLQVRDLAVVEGIGPERLTLILDSGLGCATPTSTPPPSPDVCAEPGKVDLQSASRAELMTRLGLSRNAAKRLIAARPFSQLSHVVPERVPGVGKGTLEELITRTCLTPAPVRTDTTSWRWAYPSLETTVERDGYLLTAPEGVIDEVGGAWLEITPLDIPENRPGPDYPTADFHIHGAWEGPGDTVRVTLPRPEYADEFPSDEYRLSLLHWDDTTRETGEVLVGDAVSIDPETGAVSADLSHLSFLDTFMHGFNWLAEPTIGVLFGNRYVAPPCGDEAWTQLSGQPIWTKAGASAKLTGPLINLPGNVAPLGGFIIKHCVQTGETSNEWGDSVQVRLRNNTGTIQRISEREVFNNVVDIKGDGLSIDLFASALVSIDKGGDEFLAPGSIGHMEVPAGEFGQIDMKPDVLRSLLYIALDKAFSESLTLLAKQVPALEQTVIGIARCTYDYVESILGAVASPDVGVNRTVAAAIYACTDYDLIYRVFTAALEEGGIVGDADEAFASLKKVREVVKYIQLGEIASNVGDGLVWGTFDPALIWVEHQAKKPTRDARGRSVLAHCLTPDPVKYLQWRIDMNCQDSRYAEKEQPTGGGGDTGLPPGKIVQTIDNRSFLYETDSRLLRHIPDGNTYICLTRHYAVDFEVSNDLEPYASLAVLGPPIPAEATCDGSLPATRDLSPDAVDSITVFREGSGTAWVLNGGSRYSIPSAGEFSCWVNPQYAANIEFDAWDYVTSAELARFPEAEGLVSNCGDPTNPEF